MYGISECNRRCLRIRDVSITVPSISTLHRTDDCQVPGQSADSCQASRPAPATSSARRKFKSGTDKLDIPRSAERTVATLFASTKRRCQRGQERHLPAPLGVRNAKEGREILTMDVIVSDAEREREAATSTGGGRGRRKGKGRWKCGSEM